MSLLHLVHQTLAIKFTETAKDQFDPTVAYAYRLTGVDAMGFLQLQDLRLGADGLAHETASESFWINKDFIRELREFATVVDKKSVRFTGLPAKVEAPKTPISPMSREVAPKSIKKAAAKAKLALN
jgi:hypothetical protein